MAGDTATTFERLSLLQTTLDSTIIGHICNIIRGNKRFKELYLRTITIAQPEFEAMCEALKVNTSVSTLLFESVGLSLGQFQALSKCLEVNQSVKTLRIKNDKFYPISADSIKDIFTKNTRIHTLGLSRVSFQANAFDKISEMIKSAPNLTELNFIEVELDDKKSLMLLDALKVNKTIKKLKLKNSLKAAGMMQLGELLDVNTTIEDLTIVNKGDVSDDFYERLANGLKTNYSLKSLRCMISSQKGFESFFEVVNTKPKIQTLKLEMRGITDHSPFVSFLKENRTLRQLEYFTEESLNGDVLEEVFEGIKFNRGLRRFGFTANDSTLDKCTNFFSAIKINDSLTHLYTQNFLPNERSFWSKVEESLQHNESLTAIGLLQTSPASVRPLLERNKQKQLQHIRRVRGVIKTIVLRADQFSLLLPLEIWAMILSAIEFPGVTVDFGKVLSDQINAQ